MKLLMKLVKGSLIGMSLIIPGVSGGSMAVSMGIYQRIINLATAKKGSFKQDAKALVPYGIGLILGVVVFAYFIELFFASFPLETSMVFVGLIIGALPMLFKNVRGTRPSKSNIFVLILTLAVMVALPIYSKNAGADLSLNPSVAHAFLAVFLGFVAAATMVMPGVSGSMVLMLLGYYESVLGYVNMFTSALLKFDMPSMLNSLAVLFPFAVGAVLGIILMARVIKKLLRRYPLTTYYGIIGLVLSSPFAVLYGHSFDISPSAAVICALCAAAGFAIAFFLSRGEGDGESE